MRKQGLKKLQLSKETLRALVDWDIQQAVGGASRFCSETSSSCSYGENNCTITCNHTLNSNCCPTGAIQC
jgi:hypothetical protein